MYHVYYIYLYILYIAPHVPYNGLREINWIESVRYEFIFAKFDLCFKHSKHMFTTHFSWHPFVCNISSSLFIFSAYRNYTDHLSHILPNTEESKSVFSALCCVRGSGKVRGYIAREIKMKKVPIYDWIVMCFLLQICSLNQCGFLWRPIQCVQHIDRFRGM